MHTYIKNHKIRIISSRFYRKIFTYNQSCKAKPRESFINEYKKYPCGEVFFECIYMICLRNK